MSILTHSVVALGFTMATLASQYVYEHAEPAILRFQLASSCMVGKQMAANNTPLEDWMTKVHQSEEELIPPPEPIPGR